VFSIFPTRGGRAGGTILKIYGINFGINPTVTIGNNHCPITTFMNDNSSYIECTIPGGIGLVDVIVVDTYKNQSYTFSKGYRYIDGSGYNII
jgi:hypothetical protein